MIKPRRMSALLDCRNTTPFLRPFQVDLANLEKAVIDPFLM
jgi:hypothetical protein